MDGRHEHSKVVTNKKGVTCPVIPVISATLRSADAGAGAASSLALIFQIMFALFPPPCVFMVQKRKEIQQQSAAAVERFIFIFILRFLWREMVGYGVPPFRAMQPFAFATQTTLLSQHPSKMDMRDIECSICSNTLRLVLQLS